VLAPGNRHTYLEALRPPAGFALDQAVGTTLSLDLHTLLSVPLGFAMMDWADVRGELAVDPVTLLHAIRRCADRITIFCQEGHIAAPAKHYPLFAYLEPMITEVHAPDEAGVFHAKTWLLRFTGDEGVLYRFICLSRNLTRDRSWDTVLALDGILTNRDRAFSRNHPLGDFIAALPGLVRHDLPSARRAAILDMAGEVRRAKFELPSGFEEVNFWPIGLPGLRKSPLDGRIDRLLVVSPFVTAGFLGELSERVPSTLISRPESLEEVAPAILNRFEAVYVLEDAAVEEETDERLPEDGSNHDHLADIDVRGLHAKLFIADQGWDASVWTGSANATTAAFQNNVEFVVQLRGKKKRGNVGIDAFLGDEQDGGGFRALLRPFQIGEQRVIDLPLRANEDRVETARGLIARLGLRLRVQAATERSCYDLLLFLPGGRPIDLGGAQASCWPVALNQSFERDVAALGKDGSVLFPNLTVHSLSSFVAFEVAAGEGAKRVVARFALNLPLEGAPEDRLEQALSSVLRDREQLLRYLLLLLARDEDIAVVGPSLLFGETERPGEGGTGVLGFVPLFEELLRAFARSPEKLDTVARLIEDLRRTPEGAALLPDGFDEVWKPIWDARVASRNVPR